MTNAVETTKSSERKLATFRTPQELVHIKHGISLLQYKYWMLMLKAYRDLYESTGSPPDDEMVYLTRAKLEDALEYQPKSTDIESDLEKIRKEPIVYNVLEKDGTPGKSGSGFIAEWFVSSARIGVIFPPTIRRAIEDLDQANSIFLQLNWQVFNSFSGKYEAIIYKLCKDYIGVGQTPYMELQKFREYMGIGQTEYAEFKQLNQWAISGPVKKINESELSEIIIEMEFKREKRKIVGLKFYVSPKKQGAFDFGDEPAFRFAKIHITRSLQQQYLEGRSPSDVSSAIDRANEYGTNEEAKGKAVNYGALYRRAINEDWGKEFVEKKQKDEVKKKVEAVAKKKATKKAVDEETLRLRDEFKSFRTSQLLKELSPTERQSFASVYLEELPADGRPTFSDKKMEFSDKVEQLKFNVWLRKHLNFEVDEKEFQSWLKSRKASAK